MFGRPAVLGPPAVVIRPDDLVQEAVATEDGVQQHLAVVHFAIVDVEVQAAVRFQDAVRFGQARFKNAR